MENEGSFLVGALAALLTQDTSIDGINEDKIIGMVGGVDLPVIRNFKVGYEAGAKYIESDTRIETIYAGDFEDPAKGKNALWHSMQKVQISYSMQLGKPGKGYLKQQK